jgi:hypothetical protein
LACRAATVARVLIIPFVVAYTALDSILGIAWGIAVKSDPLFPYVSPRTRCIPASRSA